MTIQHKDLAAGRWFLFSLAEQMANVGSEVERAIKWKHKRKQDYERLCVDRALELLDLTIADKKNKGRLREIVRVREFLVDFFLYDNYYCSTDKAWQNYFLAFACKARNCK